MSIKELQKQIHENAKNKGFWDAPANTGEKLMLIVSEVAEAMEADRQGMYCDQDAIDIINKDGFSEYMFKGTIKNKFEDECADAVIRILDLCESKGIDLEWHIKQKMIYNATRPHMHGKKY